MCCLFGRNFHRSKFNYIFDFWVVFTLFWNEMNSIGIKQDIYFVPTLSLDSLFLTFFNLKTKKFRKKKKKSFIDKRTNTNILEF